MGNRGQSPISAVTGRYTGFVEPFRLTRQTVTFLVFITVVAIAVAVAAPFGSIVLASLSVMAIGVMLIKAMLRARQWWPLTAVEGTVAVSGLVLVAGGFGVIGYSIATMGIEDGPRIVIGWPTMDRSRTGESRHSVSYGDPDMQQRLKDALREAGIPFTVTTRDGKEFVGWSPEHNAAADAVNEKVRSGPLGAGRNVHFPDPKMHQQFVDWLNQKGVKHQVGKLHGKDYVAWDESLGDLVSEFMESRAADCKGKVAGAKPGTTRC